MLIKERLYQILKIVKILFEIKIHFFQYLLCHCCNIVKKNNSLFDMNKYTFFSRAIFYLTNSFCKSTRIKGNLARNIPDFFKALCIGFNHSLSYVFFV